MTDQSTTANEARANHHSAADPIADLPAAAAEMAALLIDCLGVHIYSFEDGEKPDADCAFVSSIHRVRDALGLPRLPISA